MNKYLILGLLAIVLLSGCYQHQYKMSNSEGRANARLVDTANMDRINDCTELDKHCESLKCLCNTVVSEDSYCEQYNNLCVGDVCKKGIKNVSGIIFMNEDYETGCIFVYENTVILHGIDTSNLSYKTLNCLAEYRISRNVSSDDINDYFYKNRSNYSTEKIHDDYYNMIPCEE